MAMLTKSKVTITPNLCPRLSPSYRRSFGLIVDFEDGLEFDIRKEYIGSSANAGVCVREWRFNFINLNTIYGAQELSSSRGGCLGVPLHSGWATRQAPSLIMPKVMYLWALNFGQ
jgi:hypothetical protein